MGGRLELSVIVPCYNESENIRSLVKAVLEVLEGARLDGELLVVDDDSPDGTGRIAEGMRAEHPRLNVIVRKNERGLSSAIVRGFAAARGNLLLVMDADFSHPPGLIPALVAPLRAGTAEMAIASRYVKGGGVKDWPLKRRLISRGATALARLVTPVRDPMSGYFAMKRSVIEGVKLDPKGYKIALEVLARGRYRNIAEIPFVFQDRRAGQSKLDRRIMGEYVSHLTGLLFSARSSLRRFAMFCAVGASGTAVNLAVLYALTDLAGVFYLLSAAVAFCAAVTSNFLLNRLWTFREEGRGASLAGSYAKFVAVSTAGLALNLVLLYFLVDRFHIWYIFSQVISILVVTVWNYMGSRAWAFRA